VSEPAEETFSSAEPVRRLPGETDADNPEPGIALCLSGGGYRAMLFHLGALWRLNDVGFLPKLDRVSSVSGGSITAGFLAQAWSTLNFDSAGVGSNFRLAVVDPVRRLAEHTVDLPTILIGIARPGPIGNQAVRALQRYAFGETTLQDLPDEPRFVFNATNLQSAVLWRFSKPYMRDYRVGEVLRPRVPLATAVAASAAFPPFLSPVQLQLDEQDYTAGSGDDLQRPPFSTRPVLTDGGVYDNLGLETAWKRYRTILISDGGGRIGGRAKVERDWPRHAHRVLNVIDSQVRALRKRQAINGFREGRRAGAYWGIRTNIGDYGVRDTLPCPFEQTRRLGDVATRLKKLDAAVQERLINWGFAVCDTALRRHVDQTLAPAAQFPYPDRGVG
jgi:NTE family protein